VTIGILLLLSPDGSNTTSAFWGPVIGIAIRDREKAARARLDQGLAVDRRSLLSPPWLEPVCAVVLTGAAIGVGLLVDALFGHGRYVTAEIGACMLTGSAICYVGLLVVLRTLRRRRRRRRRRRLAAD
jgi:ABC-type cobalamin transport system permease subunit